ncbi:MAG: DNA cytosine methyltransferase [Oscillospiraceae bacterium]
MLISEFYDWLILEKNMSVRSAKDVISRYKRVERIIGTHHKDIISVYLLTESAKYAELSMFIKSQLKRAATLYSEFLEKSQSEESEKATMKRYNVIDLFCGVGGLSYGFSNNENFNIIAANEIEKDIATAYSLNHKNVKMFNCNITNFSENQIAEITENNKIDIIVGGPPCQSYSTLGKRKLDERANLFLEYKRILSIVKPKAFVFENVVGMLSMDSGKLFKKICSEFENLGYIIKHQILNAVNFGTPQYRERVILVGVLGNNNYTYPSETHGDGKLPFVTLSDAFADLPSLISGEQSSQYLSSSNNEFLNFVRKGNILTEHKAPKNGEHLIKIMQTLKDGQCKGDLPEDIRPKSGYGNTYAKLWWDRPSTTITRNFACPSSSRCVHPRDSRALTIREGARLQSFPDDYKFYGSDGMKRLEIGNAVPPLLSIQIANQMLKMLKEEDT